MFKPTLFKGLIAGIALFAAVGPVRLESQDWIPARYLTIDGYEVVTSAACEGREDCQRTSDGGWLKPNYRAISWETFTAQATADVAQAAFEADLF